MSEHMLKEVDLVETYQCTEQSEDGTVTVDKYEIGKVKATGELLIVTSMREDSGQFSEARLRKMPVNTAQTLIILTDPDITEAWSITGVTVIHKPTMSVGTRWVGNSRGSQAAYGTCMYQKH